METCLHHLRTKTHWSNWTETNLKCKNPQIPIGPKISLKMHEKFMEKVNKLKKKGYNGLIGTIGQKSWENFGRKMTKIWLEFG